MNATGPMIMAWDHGSLLLRFLEAADTIRRLPAVRGPAGFKNAMPEYRQSFEDAVAAEGTREKEAFRDDWVRLARAGKDAIRRAEEVFDWDIRLMERESARVIWRFCFCRIYGTAFTDACRARRWNPRTAYRRMEQGFNGLADILNNEEVAVELPDLAHLEALHLIEPDAIRPDPPGTHWREDSRGSITDAGYVIILPRKKSRRKRRNRNNKARKA